VVAVTLSVFVRNEGILPRGEVGHAVRADRARGERDSVNLEAWSFPGHGEYQHGCGEPFYIGCMNTESHPGGKVFVKIVRHSCGRRECPVCYESWAVKEGRKAARRMARGLPNVGRGKAVHVAVGPPVDTPLPKTRGELRKLRSMCQKVLRAVGYVGGALVYHHVRCKGGVHPGQHFHYVGPGWNENVAAVYTKTGWIVKRIRVLEEEKDHAKVLVYALTHAGIAEGTHALTWWGAMAYAKLKLPPEVEVEHGACEYCGAPLARLDWLDPVKPPPGEGLADPKGFQLAWTGSPYAALVLVRGPAEAFRNPKSCFRCETVLDAAQPYGYTRNGTPIGRWYCAPCFVQVGGHVIT
jgi:hypothetical protein